LKETLDEQAALRLRKGDLDHIVDDLSEDEGDEEEAIRARTEMQLKEDKDRTRMVITAVTEGHDAVKHRMRKTGYTFEQLVSGKATDPTLADASDPAAPAAGAAEGGKDLSPLEEEMDYEEVLQRGLKDRLEREKRNRASRRAAGYSDDSDFDSAGEDGIDDNASYDTEAEMEKMKEQLAGLNEEERAIEVAHHRYQREQEKLARLKRKQMEKEFKIRRELRKQQQSQQQSQPLGLELPIAPNATTSRISPTNGTGGVPMQRMLSSSSSNGSELGGPSGSLKGLRDVSFSNYSDSISSLTHFDMFL
jgi:hypothetical protein